jgi:hypothetical protein
MRKKGSELWTNLIETGLLVLEKILKNFQCIFTLFLLSPLVIRGCPSYEKSESPLQKDDLCQLWLQIGQAVLEKKSKM